MKNYTSDDEDKPIATTKLHRRSGKQQKPVAAPRRSTRMMRSMRYWFGTCWGRGRSEDGESIGERERLLDHGKTDGDEERWDSDEETEFEEEDGDNGDDERLMGVRMDGKVGLEEPQCKKGQEKRWKGVLRGVRKCSRWT